ncbi:FAD-dependent oxidoreductase [Aliikangiella sp. G2MR2-5]|uniref:NAD(P)/FAD-dependent oxidoreductase n=1 Tax=Aliikangiella sp. G2MR2-5 TaxID=2788943 RepID=UPI0018AC5860
MKQPIADVAVVGAGIIGTCIAERLQFEGKRVLLIDRQGPGEGCSKGNAGHFATDIILPLANFSTLLSVPRLLMDPTGPLTLRWRFLPQLFPWLMRFAWAAMPHKTAATIDALKRLNRPSIERFDALLKRTGLEHLMTQKGALTIYQKPESAVKNLAHLKKVSAHGVKVEHLTGDQIRELEPALTQDVAGGLYYPDTAHTINPYRLVTSLFESFIQAGGEFKKLQVEDFAFGEKGVELLTNGENIQAREVVIACGVYSKSLAKQLGYSVPLEAERGYNLTLPEPNVELNRPVTSFERSFVMTPMEDGLRLAGTVELASKDAEENWQRADILFEHASQILPGLNKSGATHWMGRRPSLPDSLPVIGRAPKHPQVIMAFGHQHLGLTQAAVTADLISELNNHRASKDLDAFAIERF